MDAATTEKDIVIVGGGICGLATALALHRKGITSVVLERSVSLVATGSAITIFTNGWRALDQLGVASRLRQTAIPIHGLREISLDDGSQHKLPIGQEELRCLKRSILIKTLAQDLPAGTLLFGCHVIKVNFDPLTSCHVLHLQDGNFIKAKAVIGCDGANSVVSEFIGLKTTKLLSTCSAIGFTNYPNGHGFDNESIRMGCGGTSVGRIPMDDKLVYWFVGRKWTPQDSSVSKDLEMIRQSTVESVKAFPVEIMEMIERSDVNSLILVRPRYRAPWDILLGSLRKGSVTVAGDAMHVMAPFLGQGGSAALEDAIVLARCLDQKRPIGAALDEYVKQRRMRLVYLSLQTYLTGLLLEPCSGLLRFVCLALLTRLFRDPLGHVCYDCGQL